MHYQYFVALIIHIEIVGKSITSDGSSPHAAYFHKNIYKKEENIRVLWKYRWKFHQTKQRFILSSQSKSHIICNEHMAMGYWSEYKVISCGCYCKPVDKREEILREEICEKLICKLNIKTFAISKYIYFYLVISQNVRLKIVVSILINVKSYIEKVKSTRVVNISKWTQAH